MSDGEHQIAAAVARSGTVPYAVTIEAGGHVLTSDEPVSAGGADAGASPFGLVLAGLGSCTAITLQMYAARKQWPLANVEVTLILRKEGDVRRIERALDLAGALSDEQRARLADIAERTPVTLALKAGMEIHTHLR